MLVEQYLLSWRIASKRWSLEALVHEVLARANGCFLLASQMVGGASASLHADHVRCLFELEAFALSLGSDCWPSDQEIAHAMDGVLVFCLMLDTQWRETVLPHEDWDGWVGETSHRLSA